MATAYPAEDAWSRPDHGVTVRQTVSAPVSVSVSFAIVRERSDVLVERAAERGGPSWTCVNARDQTWQAGWAE